MTNRILSSPGSSRQDSNPQIHMCALDICPQQNRLYKYFSHYRFRTTGTTTNPPTSIMAPESLLDEFIQLEWVAMHPIDPSTPESVLPRIFKKLGPVKEQQRSPPGELRDPAQQSAKSRQTPKAQNCKDLITALPAELLEQILLNVDMYTVLLSAQSVSRFFRATIQNSKLLRRHLWLEPREECEKPTTIRGCHKHKIYETKAPLPPHGFCQMLNYPSVRINPLLHKFLIEKRPGFENSTTSSSPMRKLKSLTKDRHNRETEGNEPSNKPLHIPIKDLHIVFSTVKQISEMLENADANPIPQIWPDLQLLTPNPFREVEAKIGYTAFEKMECSWNTEEGRLVGCEEEDKWIRRVHYINAGRFEGVVTLRKLIERVKERHRDIYMQI
ncbi:uncharacterized protein MYCFIDRAFT_212364 [Pseudocercospora fijiensis CIRAD86]|uniref:F-box domain-containing protein n=1 Tax=Pseudocercospora fijiensis (strain CIRAD86) TaxID=383855 RepID=M2ZGT8_PSEFD|nr:uncharacterized protein MYCFIDRAFT_212364 [Pseudocercospora fijiensis CIRAD86]EME78344.1 hypothetical protein MYCFIDRAFT_212364 [Pseudocercospora fijiensis CIRAD86]